jgi:hypothetical protein
LGVSLQKKSFVKQNTQNHQKEMDNDSSLELLEKISSLKPNFTQKNVEQGISNINYESFIPFAGQVVTNYSLNKQINEYLLKSVELGSGNTDSTANILPDSLVNDYFFVLCEWYKSNNDLLKFPLLNHLPTCIYIELMNKKHCLGKIIYIYLNQWFI